MVSVIIPTYNKSDLVVDTIKNVLNQKIEGLELIVIDDASTDNTEQVLKPFIKSHVQYIKNKKNLGTVLSRVRGIQRASQKYVAFLDDDDLWMPGALSKQVEKIQTADFVFCDFRVNNTINHTGYNVTLKEYQNNFKLNIMKRPGPFLQCCLFNTAFLKRHSKLFDQYAAPSEDWDFFLSLSKQPIKIAHVDEILFQWNLSEKSQSANYQQETLAIEYILRKHHKYIISEGSKQLLGLHFRRLGSMFYYKKNYNKAKQYYKKAFQIEPISIKNIIYQIIFLFPLNIEKKIMHALVKKII